MFTLRAHHDAEFCRCFFYCLSRAATLFFSARALSPADQSSFARATPGISPPPPRRHTVFHAPKSAFSPFHLEIRLRASSALPVLTRRRYQTAVGVRKDRGGEWSDRGRARPAASARLIGVRPPRSDAASAPLIRAAMDNPRWQMSHGAMAPRRCQQRAAPFSPSRREKTAKIYAPGSRRAAQRRRYTRLMPLDFIFRARAARHLKPGRPLLLRAFCYPPAIIHFS